MMFSRRDLTRLIVPLIIEQALAITIGMADTMMVSSCNESAVSAVSLVDSINFLLISVLAALATGGAIVCSQYLGRSDRSNANLAAKQLLIVSTAISFGIMVLCLIFNRALLSLIFGAVDADVMDYAETYFFWTAMSYPFLALYNGGAALFRAMGNSKVSMYISIVMNFVNIGGNALFIFVFNMDVAGAAIATLISRILGAVAMVVLLRHRENLIYVEKLYRPELRPAMIKRILSIGIPNGLEGGMFQIGKILVQSLVASISTLAITANAVASSVVTLPQIPGAAIGLALITVIGQCVGADEYEQARKYTIRLVALSYATTTVLNIAVILLARPICGLYNLSSATADVTAGLILYHCFCFMIAWPISFTLPNALRAAGDVKFTMLVSIGSMWCSRIALSYLLAQGLGMGVFGVWVAMTIDWLVRGVLFVIRFFSGRWKNRRVV